MPEFTLAEIAGVLDGELHGDPQLLINGVAEIEKAGEGNITFLANPKYRPRLEQSKASAVIIDARSGVTPPIPYILVDDAYFGFLKVIRLFYPQRQLLEPGIHPSAVIHPTAEIDATAAIGANVYIGAHVKIGKGTQIFPNCVLLDYCQVGEDCILYPLVSVREDCRIGNNVIIHNGAVIGSDGFGFAPHEGKFHKIPQVGIVVIEDEVEIGANVTIDRATMGKTIIRKGAKLDNLVHIAHNVEVGEHTVMAAQTGISGSTKIGKYVMMGGQVGTVGHITIGDRVQIGAQSGVAKSIPEGEVVFGYPARPIMKTKRIEAIINNLPEMVKRLRHLEKLVSELQETRTKNEE
ncbi:MAG: UDP-3-O-(3-hydroxymyristoyl)glucosamine N-acyltransferase [Calditrichaeota bacterium]|nr:MAG: UDP-3-O-(3-hydroxymyristoyl)glucosamine N-acyltransferase [Calditrichota bacterium]